MSKSWDLRLTARTLIGTATVSVLCDLPFRIIGLLGLIPAAGPKNTLPMLFGLLFGPLGAVGAAAGALISGVLRWQLGLDCLMEALMALLAGCAAYVLWYHLRVNSRPRCKNAREAGCLLLCIVASSVICAVMAALAPAGVWEGSALSRAVQVGGSTAAWSLLLGVPCLITATSMFGMTPPAPDAWLAQHPEDGRVDLERTIINTPECIAEMSDAIDMLALSRGLASKRGYEMMSCVEELNCLILAQLPENGKVQVRLNVGDSVVICMRYEGARYNPLAVRMQPGGPMANMDTIGILLVREMAVYAHYEYARGVNEIRIIL